jgi:hypothetical protein
MFVDRTLLFLVLFAVNHAWRLIVLVVARELLDFERKRCAFSAVMLSQLHVVACATLAT